jgi:hypothetical protein
LGLATLKKSCFALILCIALGFVPLCCWCYGFMVLLVLWVHHIVGATSSSHYEYCKYVVLLLVLVVYHVAFATLGLSHCWFVVLFLLLFVLCVTFIAIGSSHYVYSCWFIMLLLLLLVHHITYFVVGFITLLVMLLLVHCIVSVVSWSHCWCNWLIVLLV